MHKIKQLNFNTWHCIQKLFFCHIYYFSCQHHDINLFICLYTCMRIMQVYNEECCIIPYFNEISCLIRICSQLKINEKAHHQIISEIAVQKLRTTVLDSNNLVRKSRMFKQQYQLKKMHSLLTLNYHKMHLNSFPQCFSFNS